MIETNETFKIFSRLCILKNKCKMGWESPAGDYFCWERTGVKHDCSETLCPRLKKISPHPNDVAALKILPLKEQIPEIRKRMWEEYEKGTLNLQ